MPKRATAIVLSDKEQEGLLQIEKRHRSEQQMVLRARIVLAATQGRSNRQIAHELGINVDTVRLSVAGSLGGAATDRVRNSEHSRTAARRSPSWSGPEVSP